MEENEAYTLILIICQR